MPTGQFAYHKGVTKNLSFLEQGSQARVSIAEMVDPYRRVDENHSLPVALSPRDGTEVFGRPAKLSKSFGAFPCDKIFEAHSDQGRLFLDAGQLGSPGDQIVVDVDGRSHMHRYAIFAHICQGFTSVIRDERRKAEFSSARQP